MIPTDRDQQPPVAPAAFSGVERYVARYRHKASVLKQIHSNRAESARRWDVRHTLAIIFFGAAITFFGFMGPDRIIDSIAPAAPPPAAVTPTQPGPIVAPQSPSSTNKKLIDLSINSAALLLFVASLLNLIYRWKERQTEHFHGVVKLTQFINWLDEITLLHGQQIDATCIKEIRTRYQSIVGALPPNDEKDYERAKQSLQNKDRLWGKEESRPRVPLEDESALAKDDDIEFVSALIRKSTLLMHVLEKLRDTERSLWLSGGAVRNHVWSCLTGRTVPVDDFDVVYFDSATATSAKDSELEARLREKLPASLHVSVKNQARMHLVTGEPQRLSMTDAIGNYPETASCIAVRILDNSQIEVLAPAGVKDLLDLTVRPTPYHAANPESYKRRKAAKNWAAYWPEIRFADESINPAAPALTEVRKTASSA